MAREDLLSQLMIQLTQKEGPPPADDNTLIQKMIAPNETMTASDQGVTLTASDPTKFVWGGNNAQGQYISPGWKWSQGEYKRTYRDVIRFDNPVAYYRLDETTGMTVANDSSGNGNTGTISGGVTLQQAGILASDAAMGFDGSTGRVSAPAVSYLDANMNEFALEAWFNSALGLGSSLGAGWYGGIGQGSTYLGWNGWTHGFSVSFNDTSGTRHVCDTTYTVAADTWCHVVGKYDGTALYVYVNGALVGSVNVTATVAANNTNFLVAPVGGAGGCWNGLLDEVAAYKTLTEQQILSHYNARAFN